MESAPRAIFPAGGIMEISLLGALAVAASTAFGGAVAASEWRLMAYNHSFVTVLERDGLRAAGDVRDGWVAYGLADPADGLDYFMRRYEWNCSSGTSRAIHTVGYLGSQVVYEEAGTGEVTIVVPDTDEAIVL